MGMFDDLDPFKDHFQYGQWFVLEDAKLGPVVDTEYGQGQTVQLQVSGKWYSSFGQALIGQVSRMDKGDLPQKVAMILRPTRSGSNKMKLLITENQLQDADVTGPVGDQDDIPF